MLASQTLLLFAVALIAPHVRPAIAVIAGLAAVCWALLCMMVEVTMYG